MTIDQKALELLPCPFCGSEGGMNYDDASDYQTFWVWYASCDGDTCCRGPEAKTKEEAIAAWNRRALPASDHAGLVDRLNAAIKLGESMGVVGRHPSNIYNLAREAATALSARVMSVKGLEWSSLPTPMYSQAIIFGGPSRYLVNNLGSGWLLWFPGEEPSTHAGRWFEDGSDPIASHNAMRAAAQADYERRILSALSDAPVVLEGRLPTHQEAAQAAALLLRCNGHDLDTWGAEGLMDEGAEDALKALTATLGGQQ